MISGWVELVQSLMGGRKKEFVCVDARYEVKKDARSYEMLSRDGGSVMTTPLSPAKSPGPQTPDYFGKTAQYQAPARSYSSPQPPQAQSAVKQPQGPEHRDGHDEVNPLGMNQA